MTKSNIIDYLKQHYNEFHSKYNVEKIGLFGSYARDEATEDSDIDIAVSMSPKLFDMMSIKEQIENDLHKKVDIVRLRPKMNTYLKERILKDGLFV
ncbi:nucleotidyltransferase family protein [Sulfurimonas crateris]|uniref:Nucleotidyltransferase family protein n=1 Tax=Sulfurimonas crateris TaxID=2574727 RepID=A0A4U2Z7D5_9BACT|nr:nucleotidyltransferase family protein [Sulfurimonas crateris]TKI69392.1 nucleotidyltransferase family protein [Sulfurimonas crateris]